VTVSFGESAFVIAKRDVAMFAGNPANLVFLLLFFLTGALFWAPTLGHLVSLHGYFAFLIVGLLALGAYNTSFNYMGVISSEVRRGYMKYLLSLPISRIGFTIGRVAGATEGVLYLEILFVFAIFIIGAPSLFGALTILAVAILLSISLSGLGITLATHLRSDLIDPASDILGLGLVFSSTLFYPQNIIPAPLNLLSEYNVLSAGADLLRSGFGLSSSTTQDYVVLLVWSLVFAVLSIHGYYRKLDTLMR